MRVIDMYERIRNLREDKELTQKQMAEKLSVAQTTYSDYELGKLNIPISILRQLALILETSVDYLLELTDECKPYPRAKQTKI